MRKARCTLGCSSSTGRSGASASPLSLAQEDADEPVIELDDLIPPDGRPSFDHILDSPVGVSEFESEKLRLDSKRPRWKSLLQGAVLHKLRDVCPGTKDFTEQRKACVGYYLAE